uniref:Serine carboxypeptidase S28 n=1 Tax=Plectus sambesii TaxID=2011161 RepID=A0A914UYQ5_9BILA
MSVVDVVQARGKIHKLMMHGRPFHGLLPQPYDERDTKAEVLVHNFAQKLDHFDMSDNRVWLQEYWLNQQWYKPGGPIFLMLGGEGPDSQGWVTNQELTFVKMGMKYNATLITLEHRYYGPSTPTSNQTVDNLKWLSSRQALADTAFFIQSMNLMYGWDNPQWITFGGSYSGALSAWMRQQYPNIVIGAIASSGPVLAKLDFAEYIDVVQTSLSTYSPQCADNIRTGMAQLPILMQTPDGRANLTKTFKQV